MATVKFLLRRDTAANWTSVNPTLGSGEPALETDTRREKIGDGVTAWSALDYVPDGTVKSVDLSGGTTGLTTSGGPITGSGTITLGGTLALANGGTGATTQAGARTNLGLLSMATQAASAVAITGGTIYGITSAVLGGASANITYSGINAVSPSLQVVSTAAAASFMMARYSADANAGRIFLAKSRGASVGAFAAVAANDMLGEFSWAGSGASRMQEGARLSAYAESAPGSDYVATRLSFSTSDGTSVPAERLRIDSAGNTRPGADNVQTLGTASIRWGQIYSGTSTISTSDQRAKQDIESIPDEWLDAWAGVKWCRYHFRDAVREKGDRARWHVGLVAQQVYEAFQSKGIDAFAIGLLCYDEWDEERVPLMKKSGEASARTRVAVKAGSRWGLRYEECLALDAAYQDRRMTRIEKALGAMGAMAAQ